ncbi:MAG TPA: hypothetical protein VNO75_08800 [Gemmatimonadaceae bacterium]|nr:hypothetical protein [Gemmatimonadaceae bacterium]
MRVYQQDLRPDQDIVRPGTSAALTARAIDATPPPPLVQAQEAVASALPRLVDAVPSPLLGASLGFTLLFAMAASQRFRLRMTPVLMSGLLLMPVSNYHEAPERAAAGHVATAAVESSESDEESEWRDRARRDEEAEWERWRDRAGDSERSSDERRSRDDDSERSSDERRSRGGYSFPKIERVIPPDLVENWQPLIELVVPEDWSREETARFLRRNSERLRREVRRLRERHQLELRGRAYSMEHHHHHSR